MWADGDLAATTFLFGLNSISKRDIKKAEELFAPEAFVIETGRTSHMEDSQLFIHLLDTVVREIVRRRREELRRDGDPKWLATVILLVDPASQHVAFVDGQSIQRDELCVEIGLRIYEAISKWSAEGQPADQIHNLIKLYEDNECRANTGEQDRDSFDLNLV